MTVLGVHCLLGSFLMPGPNIKRLKNRGVHVSLLHSCSTYGCNMWWCADSWAAASCTRGFSWLECQTWSWDWSWLCSALPSVLWISTCFPACIKSCRCKWYTVISTDLPLKHCVTSPASLWPHRGWRPRHWQSWEDASAGQGHEWSLHQFSN